MPNPASDGRANSNLTYCPGHLWHPAYRGQHCNFLFDRNILLTGSGGGDAHFWHEPAEGICNVSSFKNVFWNATAAGGKLSATFPSTHKPVCPGYACNLHSLEPNASFASWQLRGHELGSVVKDPLVIGGDNFNVQADSPAIAMGFEPLDLMHGVGPDW